jgi:hypothetical protein
MLSVCDQSQSSEPRQASTQTSKSAEAQRYIPFVPVHNHVIPYYAPHATNAEISQSPKTPKRRNSNTAAVCMINALHYKGSRFEGRTPVIRGPARSLFSALLDSGLSNGCFAGRNSLGGRSSDHALATAPRPAARQDCRACCLLDCDSSPDARGRVCQRAPGCARVFLFAQCPPEGRFGRYRCSRQGSDAGPTSRAAAPSAG